MKDDKNIRRGISADVTRSLEKLDTIARAYEGEDGKKYIRGYAAVYGKESKMLYDYDIGPFVEVIERGAFDSVLEQDTYLCRDHLVDKIFGRTVSGTLRLWSDEIGLGFEVEMPDNVTYATDTYELVKRGDIYGCSFRAQIDPEGDSRSKREDGATLRTISSFKRLVDVAIVGNPAYPDTSVAARDLEYEGQDTTKRAYEQQLETLEEMQTKIFIIRNILEKDELGEDDKGELETVLNDLIEYSRRILESIPGLAEEVAAEEEGTEEAPQERSGDTLDRREKELAVLKMRK